MNAVRGAKPRIGLLLVVVVVGVLAMESLVPLNPRLAPLVPSLLVIVYAIVVGVGTVRSTSRDLADHQIDSIYLLGFTLTLVALALMFYRLQQALGAGEEFSTAEIVVRYVGYSVTTSAAGIIARNVVRAAYLAKRGSDDVSIERSFALLSDLAEKFSSSYASTVESVDAFLSERKDSQSVLGTKEGEYVAALEGFASTADGLSRKLSEAGKSLESSVDAFERSSRHLSNYETDSAALFQNIATASEKLSIVNEALSPDEIDQKRKRLTAAIEQLTALIESVTRSNERVEEENQRIAAGMTGMARNLVSSHEAFGQVQDRAADQMEILNNRIAELTMSLALLDHESLSRLSFTLSELGQKTSELNRIIDDVVAILSDKMRSIAR